MSLVRFRPEAPFRGFSSFGRAPPCQGGGGGFEPRNPLQTRVRNFVPVFSKENMAPWPSGKAQVCNTSIPSSNLGGASKKSRKHAFGIFSFVPQGTISFDRRSTSFRAKREHHCPLADTNERCCDESQMMCFAMMWACAQ